MIDESFPDKPYLDKLGAALWDGIDSGSASVMVGAGFSLNSMKSGGTPQLPTWNALAEIMKVELELEDDVDPLKVASLYETAFGRDQLDALVKRHIPDHLHNPGPLHQKILKLRWNDVFTTNYDTLLERAALGVPFRNYQVVTSPEDLTNASRPRIVKLHGSFPSQRPFILTEEDFRKYPTTHAPFVNTVRQSLMESAFCLVGFSGSDPNFIQWSGWVRDFLSNHARHVFMMGVLDLSTWERDYLRGRKIIPIDLGPLVRKNAPDRHAKALHAAFDYLAKDCKRPDPTKWPSGAARLNEDDVATYVEELRAQRDAYPGWLIAPTANRGQFPRVNSLLAYAKTVPDEEKVAILNELGWHLANRLEPLSQQWIPLWEDALNAHCKDDGFVLSSKRRDQIEGTALDLIRLAREDQLDALFERCAARLGNSPSLSRQAAVRVHWERCLNHLARFEYNELRELLDSWPASDDPFDQVRHAMLLAELGDAGQAKEIVEKVLLSVRLVAASPPKRTGIYHLSREAWAMLFVEIVQSEWIRFRDYDRDTATDRFEKLGRNGCNARHILNRLNQDVVEDEPSVGSEYVSSFFPGRGRFRTRWGGRGMGPGMQLLRALDDGAVPVGVPGVHVLPKSVYPRLVNDAHQSPQWLFSVFLRDGRTKSLGHWLARHQVAAMPSEWLEQLRVMSLNLVRFRLEQADGASDDDRIRQLLDYALQVYGRLAIRFTSKEQRAEAVDVLYRVVERPWHWFSSTRDGTATLIEGLFRFADIDWKLSMVAGLAGLAIPEFDPDIDPWRFSEWRDPLPQIGFPPQTQPPADVLERLKQSGTVNHLLDILNGDNPPRAAAAAMRLVTLHRLGALSDEETQRFSDTFWAARESRRFRVVLGQVLASQVYMSLPDAEEHAASHLLQQAFIDASLPEVVTTENGGTMVNMGELGGLKSRLREILKLVQLDELHRPKWATDAVSEFIRRLTRFVVEKAAKLVDRDSEFRGGTSFLLTASNCLRDLTWEFDLGHQSLEAVYETLQEHNVPTAHLAPTLVLRESASQESAVEQIEGALRSNDELAVRSACIGINWWGETMESACAVALPERLMISCIDRLRDVRHVGLVRVLDTVTALFSSSAINMSPRVAAILAEALGRLRIETEMTAEDIWNTGDAQAAPQLIPHQHRSDIRWKTAALAATLYRHEPDSDEVLSPVLQEWAEVAEDNTLPEIRYAWTVENGHVVARESNPTVDASDEDVRCDGSGSNETPDD